MGVSSPIGVLAAIVGLILTLERLPQLREMLRWLPVPLWCYALPMVAVSCGWLPAGHAAYPALTAVILPFALALLLLGLELPAILHAGGQALIATMLGSAGIVLGAPLIAWMLRGALPADAWKGVGTLAATWTGGSMNLLAMRAILGTPQEMFTSLIIVDALIAYAWMAFLVWLAGAQRPIDRWLHARPLAVPLNAFPRQAIPNAKAARDLTVYVFLALGVSTVAQLAGRRLPTNSLVSSSSGWTVLLVTTIALLLCLIRPIQRLGRHSALVGYPFLYLVLAAMGAQASLSALWSAPAWVALGAGVALVHGAVMLLGGRLLRLPLGILATASQANLGGVVSTPLVGAVYQQQLAPIGLLLAIGCNAVGTYLGLLAATICHNLF